MRMIRSLDIKTFEERLKELLNLEKKRLREDMMVLFEFLKGYHMEERTNLFSVDSESRTRSNGLKL